MFRKIETGQKNFVTLIQTLSSTPGDISTFKTKQFFSEYQRITLCRAFYHKSNVCTLRINCKGQLPRTLKLEVKLLTSRWNQIKTFQYIALDYIESISSFFLLFLLHLEKIHASLLETTRKCVERVKNSLYQRLKRCKSLSP